MRSLLFALLAVPAHAGQVWIVDQAFAPGAHFPQIQNALLAASDGDVILVRGGHYAPFTAGALSIAIAADELAVVDVDGPLRVVQTNPAARLLVQGLRFTTVPIQSVSTLETCAGLVQLERCSFTNLSFGLGASPDGLHIEHSANVVLTSCTVRSSVASGAAGGHGIAIDAALVHAYGCDVAAADLGLGKTTNGGDAVVVSSGAFHAFDSSLRGGKGSDAVTMTLPGSSACFPPGNGGSGLRAVGANASAVLHACSVSGGASGAPKGTCTGGAAGVAIGPGAGQVAQTSGVNRGYTAKSPLRGGEALALSFHGAAAELALVAYSAAPASALDLGALGTWWLAAPWVVTAIGVLDANGALATSFIAADPGSGASGVAIPSQAIFVSAAAATAEFGSTASVVLLDANVP